MNPPVSKRQRLLLIAAAAGLLLLVLDRVLFTPLGRLWQAHRAEIVSLQQSIDNARSLISRTDQLRRTWADMQSGALPKDPGQAEQDLITAFDRWGRAGGIEIGSIRPQWKRGSSDRYSLLECRVDATGSLAALSRFLYELERSPLALRVDSLELTARDDRGQKIGLSLTVTGLRLSPLEGRP
jgi:hypothetical protein